MNRREQQDAAFNRELGDRLRLARISAKRGQKDAARALACTVGQISKYEAGDNPIKPALLARLATLYGCEAADLFVGLRG